MRSLELFSLNFVGASWLPATTDAGNISKAVVVKIKSAAGLE